MKINFNPDERHKPVLKKFKKNPKYPHHRSDGMTWRTNKGTALQPVGNKRRQ